MASIYKRKGRKNWTIEWFDEHGRRRSKSSRTTDKRYAQRIANDIEADVALRRAGLIDARQEGLAKQGRRPVEVHVEDFLQSKRDARRKARSIGDLERVLRWAIEATGAKVLADLDADSIGKALRQLQEDGKAARTRHRHHTVLKGFLAWCARLGRLASNPMDVIAAPEVEGGEVRKRRSLDHEEVQRLFEVAAERGRLAWYMTALWAGLRRSELTRLQWGDIDFEAGTLTVRGGKARRLDVLPLHPDLAEELLAIKPHDVLPSARVFPTTVTNATRRKDFTRAGIVLVDDEGRHADLHSLRGTLGTLLARKGTAPQVARQLMRHSDYKTTLKHYTHLHLEDLRGALDGLGTVMPTDSGLAAGCATGTDGTSLAQADSNIPPPLDRQQIRQHPVHGSVHLDASRCESGDTASDDEPTDHLRLLEPASAQKPPSAQKERGSVDQEHDHAILSGLEHEHDGGMAKWLRRRIANP